MKNTEIKGSHKSVKLTFSMRDGIAHRVLDHRFGKAETELRSKEHKLAADVLKSIYKKNVVQLMEKLPASFLGEAMAIYVALGEKQVRLALPAPTKVINLSDRKPIMAYSVDHPFTVRFNELSNEWRRLTEEKTSARKHVMGVLDSVPTTKRLLEVWPEVEPFLDTPEAPKAALAVRIPDLNRTLRLPVGG